MALMRKEYDYYCCWLAGWCHILQKYWELARWEHVFCTRGSFLLGSPLFSRLPGGACNNKPGWQGLVESPRGLKYCLDHTKEAYFRTFKAGRIEKHVGQYSRSKVKRNIERNKYFMVGLSSCDFAIRFFSALLRLVTSHKL